MLTAQKAILRCESALDVDETEDVGWIAVSEEQCSQASYRVSLRMKLLDFEARGVISGGFSASRSIVGDRGMILDTGMVDEVVVISLSRSKPVGQNP